jgi:hypothetical protein
MRVLRAVEVTMPERRRMMPLSSQVTLRASISLRGPGSSS